MLSRSWNNLTEAENKIEREIFQDIKKHTKYALKNGVDIGMFCSLAFASAERAFLSTKRELEKEEKLIIDRIVDRALELEGTTMKMNEEPEIGINEETGMITISRYSESYGGAIWIEDFCNVIDVDLERLRNRLEEEHIAYCL